jgi:hypothetical protein
LTPSQVRYMFGYPLAPAELQVYSLTLTVAAS